MIVLVAAVPAMVSGFVLSPSRITGVSRAGAASVRMAADTPKQRVLVIGGTRFSGLYLTKELHSRGHEVCYAVSDLRHGAVLDKMGHCV